MQDGYFLPLVMLNIHVMHKQQLASNASLKRDLKDQILSPSDMFQFCRGNTRGNTNAGATQIPGTRSFHEFSPIDQSSIETKRASEDKEPSYVHNFKNQTKSNLIFFKNFFSDMTYIRAET